MMRHFESTDEWVACSQGSGGLYLIQKAVMDRPKNKNQQNLLKLEVAVGGAELKQEGSGLVLSYKLHLSVRLSKILYVDYVKNFGKIGE